MTDLKRALEYAAMKADQRDYNDRRIDDANLKAVFLEQSERSGKNAVVLSMMFDLLREVRPFIYRAMNPAKPHAQDKIDAKELWPKLTIWVGEWQP